MKPVIINPPAYSLPRRDTAAHVAPPSDGIVMEIEVDIPRVSSVGPDKFLVSLGPFVLGVTSQHALEADTDTLDIVNGAPSLRV